MEIGRSLLGRAEVLPGVAAMIHEVQVEGTFADGTKLVTVHDPICRPHGDLALALHGSFFPVPPAFPDAARRTHPATMDDRRRARSSSTPAAPPSSSRS